MIYYWQLNKLKIQHYSTKKKRRVRRIGIVFKFRKVSSKKVLKKIKTNALLRVIKLNLEFRLLSNTPPLGTLLNLIGLNVQKFCDDVNKDFKLVLLNNFVAILRINILKDLTFNYLLNINYTYLLKNFYFVPFLETTKNLFTINFFRLIKKYDFEDLIVKRLYLNSDLLFITYTFLILQRYILNFNLLHNSNFSMLDNWCYLMPFELFFRNLISILKSFNIKLFNLKLKTHV